MTSTKNNSETQDQLKVAQSALRIARLLGKSENLEAAVENMMHEFVNLAQAHEGSIRLLRPRSQTTHCTLIREEKKEGEILDKRLDDFLTGCVLDQKKALLAHELSSLLDLETLPNGYAQIRSILSIPIMIKNEIAGVVNLIRAGKTEKFTPADKTNLTDLIDQIGEFIENAELREKLFTEKARLQKNLEERYSVHGILGNSPSIREVYDLLERIIPGDARVVIVGESGTGKELIAKCIHYAGPRKDRPFVAVDCGALPANLLESELFGYVRGAFTGAIRDRRGLIEEAHNGTLFLDEFTNMSTDTQAKLLRVIQEGEFRPIGSNQVKKVDVRIIVAASSNLKDKLSSGEIRSDLYYRLNVVSVPIPPLRERIEDIPLLTVSFLPRFAEKHKKKVNKISPEALQIFEHYSWPGNIRELENVIERAVVMMDFKEKELLPDHLPIELTQPEIVSPPSESPDEGDLFALVAEYEKQLLEGVLKKSNWNKEAAARVLHTSAPVIRYKMKRLGIVPPE